MIPRETTKSNRKAARKAAFLSAVKKGKAFFDKGFAVCSRKVLYPLRGNKIHTRSLNRMISESRGSRKS